MKYVTIINDQQFEIEILKDGSLIVNGKPHEVDFLGLGSSLYSIISDKRSLEVVIEEEQSGQYAVLVNGRLYEGQVLDQRALLMAQRKGGLGQAVGELHSPMPGLIVVVPVEVGQEVTQGQTVAILESMKMQNELKAPRSGIIESIQVSAGNTVDKGTLLLVISETSTEA